MYIIIDYYEIKLNLNMYIFNCIFVIIFVYLNYIC